MSIFRTGDYHKHSKQDKSRNEYFHDLVFLVNAYNVSVKVHKFGLGDCEYSFIVAASLINQFF